MQSHLKQFLFCAVTFNTVGTSFSDVLNTFTQSKTFAPYSYSYEKKDAELDKKVNAIFAEEKRIIL